ncbi:TetR/AcrR family transcriptional regulator [Priestia filamentosa]|uniref:TetR/AcrR family transcriptional regulator n=2 Tax=Priestia filamentosa TaxID=1402861 RepID=UPI000E75F561|nr:TetR/AcrR family transcriptional regulator [Priestia filamentosa]RJS62845.1 hypothetical protein CJ485_24430 [Priestia filamentosa]
MRQEKDPRVIRTKILLYNALINLTEKVGINKVNVRNLTEEAGLNRATFYLHYRDIYEFLEKVKQYMFQGLQCIFDHSDFNNLPGSEERSIQVFTLVFEYLSDNHLFFKTMLGPNGDPSYKEQLKEFMKKNFYKDHLEFQPDAQKMLVPRDYLVAHVTSSILGIIQHWFESNMNFSPKEMALIVYRLLESNINELSGETDNRNSSRLED